MRDQLVLRIVTKFAIPFILLFGFYVLLHGKYSPGGGFQAGVIIAAAFISYGLIFGAENALKVVPLNILRVLAALGTLIFGAVGIAGILSGGNFLNFNLLLSDPHQSQFWMIMLVEAAIGLTVATVMTALFFIFVTYPLPPADHDTSPDEGADGT